MLARRVASCLRWNTPLLVLATALWPGLGDAAGQSIDPAFQIRPRIAEAVKAQRLLPRTGKVAVGETSLVPRATHRPVLTGTEGFSVDGFRSSLAANGGPYNEFRTAQGVLDAVAYDNTYGMTGRMANLTIGGTLLGLNWVYATLLGDSVVADRYANELSRLGETDPTAILEQSSGTPTTYELFGTHSPEQASVVLSQLAFTLRASAITILAESAGLPNAIDPEGFVRQTLRSYHDVLIDMADSLRDFDL